MPRTCEVCGGPIRVDNRYGICNLTTECRRQKGLAKYYRYHDAQKERAVAYDRANRETARERERQRYMSNKHSELTYVVWSPGLRFCKIGITTILKERLSNLRNACPDITLLATFPCGRPLELYLHATLRPSRVRGEWFDLGDNPITVLLSIARHVEQFAKGRIENA